MSLVVKKQLKKRIDKVAQVQGSKDANDDISTKADKSHNLAITKKARRHCDDAITNNEIQKRNMPNITI